MIKTMAQIQNGVVSHIGRYIGRTPETETLVLVNDPMISVGDTYKDGKFYRDGKLISAPIEALYKELSEYSAAFTEIESALGVTVKVQGTIDTIVNARKQAILSRVDEMLNGGG